MPVIHRRTNPANYDVITYTVPTGTKISELDITHQDLVIVNNHVVDDPDHILIDDDIVSITPVIGGASDNPVLNVALGAGLMFLTGGLGGTAIIAGKVGAMLGGIGTSLLAGGVLSLLGFGPASQDQASPTYQIGSVTNRARPMQPMPLVIGSVRMTPDLATKPYITQDTQGNSYFRLALNWGINSGVSQSDITDIMIGETPLSHYTGLSTKYTTTGDLGILTNIDTLDVSGEVKHDTPGITVQSSDDTIGLEILIGGLAYDKETGKSRRVYASVEYRRVGDPNWTTVSDGEVIGGNAMYLQPGKICFASREIRYHTYRVTDLQPGKYEVRVVRHSNSGKWVEKIIFSKLFSHQQITDSAKAYKDQNIMLISGTASAELKSTISKITGIVTPKIYAGVAGQIQHTTNPAWWFYHILRGDNNRGYGAGIDDSLIDLQSIQEWAQYCDTNNLEIGLVIDRRQNVYDVLDKIARVGDAKISIHTGKIGVIFGDHKPIVWLYSDDNMMTGRSVTYTTQETITQVSIDYYDRDNNYQLTTLSKFVDPNNPDTLHTHKLDGTGVITRQHAERLLHQAVAEYIYRNKSITYTTDLEGLVLRRGDRIAITGLVKSWGDSGRVVSISGNTLTLDNTIHYIPGKTYYARIMSSQGQVETVSIANPGQDSNQVTLTQSVSFGLSGDEIVQIGDTTQDTSYWIIDKISPKVNNQVEIQAISDPDDYYSYISTPSGVDEVTISRSVNTAKVLSHEISLTDNIDTGIDISLSLITQSTSSVDIDIRCNDELYQRHRVTDNRLQTTIPITTVTCKIVITPNPIESIDDWEEYVIALGHADLETRERVYLPRVTGVRNIIDDHIGHKITWRPIQADDDTGDDYIQTQTTQRIKYEITVNDVYYTTTTDTTLAIDYEPGQSRDLKIGIKAIGDNGKESYRPTYFVSHNPQHPPLTNIQVIPRKTGIDITYDNPDKQTDFAGVAVWVSTTNPPDTNQSPTYTGTANPITITGLSPDTPHYVVIAPYDVFGKDSLNYSSVYEVTPTKFDALDADAWALVDEAMSVQGYKIDGTGNIQAASILSPSIAAGAIVSDKIAANQISGTHIQAGSIQTDHLGAGVVTADKVTSGELITSSTQIRNATIDSLHVANRAITSQMTDIDTSDRRARGSAVWSNNRTYNLHVHTFAKTPDDLVEWLITFACNFSIRTQNNDAASIAIRYLYKTNLGQWTAFDCHMLDSAAWDGWDHPNLSGVVPPAWQDTNPATRLLINTGRSNACYTPTAQFTLTQSQLTGVTSVSLAIQVVIGQTSIDEYHISSTSISVLEGIR